MTPFDQLYTKFSEHLSSSLYHEQPASLYEPINYLLQIGGKRLRPILLLSAAELFKTRPEVALPAALAVEVFHNFSLMHDDIMDQADFRRGQPAVHKKYNVNTGILSGDAMLILSHLALSAYRSHSFYPDLIQTFNHTALQVCEGQQMDMDFELEQEVLPETYIQMITGKTAVLIAASLKMGAQIGQAPQEDQDQIYDFGRLAGIAFQIQDDFLDTFGVAARVGKRIGGDIIQGKKTYLYTKALEVAEKQQRVRLKQLYDPAYAMDEEEKIKLVKQLFIEIGVDRLAQEAIQFYFSASQRALDQIEVDETQKQVLRKFARKLIDRDQ